MWVPKTRPCYATCAYSWSSPPRRSCRWTREVLSRVRVGKRPQWCGLAEGAVRTVLVEVPLVLSEDGDRVALVDDEDPVQQLAAQAADLTQATNTAT